MKYTLFCRLLRDFSAKTCSSMSVVQSNYQQNELETYSQIDKSNVEEIMSKVNPILNILVCHIV